MIRKFNPLDDLIVAQSNKPQKYVEINLRALSPFHRALLVIDGTVTKFIEAYTMDPIEVVRISQEERSVHKDNNWLDILKGQKVIIREVLLRGSYSSNFYAYANSIIVRDRLPENIIDSLNSDPGGIGRILLTSRQENYREVLWYGMEYPEKLPPQIQQFENEAFISRTYRIIADQKPLMLINEKFPLRVEIPHST